MDLLSSTEQNVRVISIASSHAKQAFLEEISTTVINSLVSQFFYSDNNMSFLIY